MNGEAAPRIRTMAPVAAPYSMPLVQAVAPISATHSAGPTSQSRLTIFPSAYAAGAPGGYCENQRSSKTTWNGPLNASTFGGAGSHNRPAENTPAWKVYDW